MVESENKTRVVKVLLPLTKVDNMLHTPYGFRASQSTSLKLLFYGIGLFQFLTECITLCYIYLILPQKTFSCQITQTKAIERKSRFHTASPTQVILPINSQGNCRSTVNNVQASNQCCAVEAYLFQADNYGTEPHGFLLHP